MPHLTIEYSANLRERANIPALLQDLSATLASITDASGNSIFPVAGTRVRAYACTEYLVANDQVPDAGFVDANLKIAPGRSPADLQSTGSKIMAVMQKHFEPLQQQQGIALSFYIYEFAPPGTWKHNNLHRLLKKD